MTPSIDPWELLLGKMAACILGILKKEGFGEFYIEESEISLERNIGLQWN